jgi:predicted enzyme related to lactoylglutathione lyase
MPDQTGPIDEDEFLRIKAQVEKDMAAKAQKKPPTEPPKATIIVRPEEKKPSTEWYTRPQEPEPEPEPLPEKKTVIPKVVHFEVNADDPLRAKTFYENVFGWRVEKMSGPTNYWVIATGDDGITGGIMKRMNPRYGVQNIINVASVDEYLKRVTDSGGKVIVPKRSMRGVGYHAYCEDTEGNVFGVMESDMAAE